MIGDCRSTSADIRSFSFVLEAKTNPKLKQNLYLTSGLQKPRRGEIWVAPGKDDEGGRNPGIKKRTKKNLRIHRSPTKAQNNHAPETENRFREVARLVVE